VTACASVADVLALGDPATVSLYRIARTFRIGYDRARVVRDLALESAQGLQAVMREHRMSEGEARDFVRMQQQPADSRARSGFPWNR